MRDLQGRSYAKLSQLKPGDEVIPDDGFDCLLPWQPLKVVEVDGELAVIHNTSECGACGGADKDCPHGLEGQLMDDGDSLVEIYRKEDFNANPS